MAAPASAPPKPRKLPRQARSAATVEAIFAATIQLLSKDSLSQLTTTRVAERAGVSVGTMYQYFPHKQALLYALLQRQLGAVARAMEEAGERLMGQPLAVVSDGLAAAWLTAKTRDVAASRALYAASAEFDIVDLLGDGPPRIQGAIERSLASATDAVFEDPKAVSFALRAVLGGAVRAVLERGATPEALAMLRAELPVVCRAYLEASARPRLAQ